MAAVLQATWPLGKDLASAGLPDALDLHLDQLRQRQGTRGDHAERVRWDAPPPSAAAILLTRADTLLAMNTTARRDAVSQPPLSTRRSPTDFPTPLATNR